MNGIIYCRVSSKEQIEGTSLESQAAACDDYARQHKIAILKTFVERGESAKFADRTQLLALLDYCKEHKGQIEALLVWKLDRFARNVGDHFNIKASLLKYGVQVISVTEPIDAKPEGKLMETILAGFAQFDNDIRATRSVQGMQRKLLEGIFPWKAPYGYKSSVKGSEKKNQPDEPDQPLFGKLQQIWREFATGSYTMAEIGRLMANRGILAAKGKLFSPQSLHQFFTNPFYAGTLKNPWTGDEHEGKHIPMVSRADFARVQQIISANVRSHTYLKERPEFPLRGTVRCPDCHWPMTAGLSRGRSKYYPYYCCRNRQCTIGGSFAQDEVLSEFKGFLDKNTPSPEMFEAIGKAVIKLARDRIGACKPEQVKKRTMLEIIERQRNELIRMKLDGLVTDQEFLINRQQLGERQMAIEAGLQAAQFDLDEIRAQLAEIKRPLCELRATWEQLSPQLQRRFNQWALPVGFVRGKIGTAEKGLVISTFRGFTTANSIEVPRTRENLNRFVLEIAVFAGMLCEAKELKSSS